MRLLVALSGSCSTFSPTTVFTDEFDSPACPARPAAEGNDSQQFATPAAPPPPVTAAEPDHPPSPDCVSLWSIYETLCGERDALQKIKSSSVREIRTAVEHFDAWLREVTKNDHRSVTPEVILSHIANDRYVLRRFLRYQVDDCGHSERTALKKITSVCKLLNEARNIGWIAKLPERPSKTLEDNELNETVTLEEMRAIRNAVHAADWPEFSGVDPADFWLFAIDYCWTYGTRRNDIFSTISSKPGLLWSHVHCDAVCPASELKGFQHPHGWIWFPVGKQSRKGRRLLLPLSERVRSHIETFRGIDPERVVPLPYSNKTFGQHWLKILDAAGVDRRIRLSEGRGIPAFRKGCTDQWESLQPFDAECCDYVLGHRSKSMRGQHYGQTVKRVAERVDRIPF